MKIKLEYEKEGQGKVASTLMLDAKILNALSLFIAVMTVCLCLGSVLISKKEIIEVKNALKEIYSK